MAKTASDTLKFLANEYSEISVLQDFTRTDENDSILIKEFDLAELDVFNSYVIQKRNKKTLVLQVFSVSKYLGKEDHISEQSVELCKKSVEHIHNVSAQLVAEVVCCSSKERSVLLQLDDGFSPLASQLQSGDIHMSAVSTIGSQLASLHTRTTLSRLSTSDGADLLQYFDNQEVVKLLARQTFQWQDQRDEWCAHVPADVAEAVSRLYNDETIGTIGSLRDLFVNKKRCLIHGNLFPAAILTSDTGDVKLAGAVSAHVGCASFDVATLLAGYIFTYHLHMLTPENNDQHRQVSYKMLTAAKDTVEAYFQKLAELQVNHGQAFMQQFMAELSGFCGCILVKQALLAAYGKEQSSVAVETISSASRLLHAWHRIPTVDKLLFIGLQLC